MAPPSVLLALLCVTGASAGFSIVSGGQYCTTTDGGACVTDGVGYYMERVREAGERMREVRRNLLIFVLLPWSTYSRIYCSTAGTAVYTVHPISLESQGLSVSRYHTRLNVR